MQLKKEMLSFFALKKIVQTFRL